MIFASDHRNSRVVMPESQSQRQGVGAPDDSDFRGFREPVRAQPDSPPYRGKSLCGQRTLTDNLISQPDLYIQYASGRTITFSASCIKPWL